MSCGIARKRVGEPRRHAEDQRDEFDDLRILPDQRQQPSAGAQPGEEVIECGKRDIRILRPREMVDDQRH